LPSHSGLFTTTGNHFGAHYMLAEAKSWLLKREEILKLPELNLWPRVVQPVSLSHYTSAGESMAHRMRSFAHGSYCCPNFLFLLPEQCLYTAKNAYIYTYWLRRNCMWITVSNK
jgi:hypothetical protein